ncbi:MAG: hypothetical protein EOP76_11785 [Variovorax sp.]|nr:MAG: hypothetical protein EOP76_11785 [Variovorax sp.]
MHPKQNQAVILDPSSFFAELGGLHDARIQQIAWNASARSVSLEVADLNANSLGLPEYPGTEPAIIVFNGAENLAFGCDAFVSDIQRVYDVEIEEMNDGKLRCTLLISPSGRLTFGFSSAALRKHQ